jgi:hypothetical protein
MDVREINPALWDEGHDCADAITSLGTQNNELSFWEVDDEVGIEDIALAIALRKSKISGLYVAKLPINKISRCFRIHVEPSDGETKYEEIRHKHRNFCHLKIRQLSKISKLIHANINDNAVEYYSELTLKKKFLRAISEQKIDRGRIEQSEFNKQLRKIEKELLSPITE